MDCKQRKDSVAAVYHDCSESIKKCRASMREGHCTQQPWTVRQNPPTICGHYNCCRLRIAHQSPACTYMQLRRHTEGRQTLCQLRTVWQTFEGILLRSGRLQVLCQLEGFLELPLLQVVHCQVDPGFWTYIQQIWQHLEPYTLLYCDFIPSCVMLHSIDLWCDCSCR